MSSFFKLTLIVLGRNIMDEQHSLLPSTKHVLDQQHSSTPTTSSNVSWSNDKVENLNCETCVPCDPRQNLHRYIILFLVCLLTLGSYYCYENTTSLQRTIIQVVGVDSSHYSVLDSVYSWPNVILPAVGGFLIDRVLGIRVAMVAFCTIISIGQLIVSLGGYLNLFWILVIGRFVFGLGGENLLVARFTYAVLWFKPTELNMVFGFLLCVSRIGSTLDLNFNQKLYDASMFIGLEHIRLGSVFMAGFGLCIFSLLCALVFGLFDRRAEAILKRTQEKQPIRKREIITFKDITGLPWLIFIICVTFYVAVLPFVGLSTTFLVSKYGLSFADATFVNSFVYIIPSVAFPFIGILVDKTGFNLIWLNFGILTAMIAHALFIFSPSQVAIPYVAMSLMGIAYSIFACVLWPLIAFTVPEYLLGTAYGIMLSMQNLGLTIVSIVVDSIEVQYGYFVLEMISQSLLCITLTTGILLYIIDTQPSSGGILNMSGCTRAKLQNTTNGNQYTTKTPKDTTYLQRQTHIVSNSEV